MTEEEIKEVMEEYKVNREQAKKILEARTKGHEEARKIEVEINAEDFTEKVTDLAKQLKEKEAEAEDYREKLSIIAEREFARKKKALGCTDSEVTTPSELRAWQETHSKALELAYPERFSSGGQATLDQATGKSRNLEFSSQEEMVDYLRTKASSGDKEAKAILDEMFLKASKGFVEQDRGSTVYEDKSKIPLTEQLNKGFREKLKPIIERKMREERRKKGESS